MNEILRLICEETTNDKAVLAAQELFEKFSERDRDTMPYTMRGWRDVFYAIGREDLGARVLEIQGKLRAPVQAADRSEGNQDE